MTKKIIIYVLVGLLIVSAIILYYYVNPETSVAMPKCPFKLLTGYACPSCGSQRALYAVLHGDFIKALSLNPFFIISVPYFLLVLYANVFKSAFAKKAKGIACHRYTLSAYIVLFFVWWIVRNVWF